MKFLGSSEKVISDSSPERAGAVTHGTPLEDHQKGRWERSWPTIACGAGLFSDGYVNGSELHTLLPVWLLLTFVLRKSRVIGQVNTILKTLYGTRYTNSSAQSNVNSIAFAGTVVGQLFFGWMSDHVSRKWALMTSTVILFIFAALSAGSYGGGTINGMLQALTAWRFLLGIGIGCVSITRASCLRLTEIQWRISGWQCSLCGEHWRTERGT